MLPLKPIAARLGFGDSFGMSSPPGWPRTDDRLDYIIGEGICLEVASVLHCGVENDALAVQERSPGHHADVHAACRGQELTAEKIRVALLTNTLSPHSLPVCEGISFAVKEFRAFLSSAEDRYHKFPKPEASFRITVQRSFNHLRFPRKVYGHWQKGDLHVPYDTYLQLRAYDPDLILSVQLGLRTALAAIYRMRRPEVKLILWATLSLHTEARRHWMRRALRRWIVGHIDGAFVNGRQGEDYLRLLGYQGPVTTIPYAIDQRHFAEGAYRPRQGTFRLIYAGQLVPQKGLRPFCHALNRWCAAHPEVKVRFDLVGDGSDARALRTLPTERNLAITIFRPMDQERLAAHYHEADMLAFPTLGDEWGVVVNEAMIAGLPVLGSLYSQAVVELVKDGVTGWVFDPRDDESLFKAFDRAFACSVEDLEDMSLCGQERIAEISPAHVALWAVRAMEQVCGEQV